jgi:hypothetical protein
MNHLGGCGFVWVMLSDSLGSCHQTSEPPGVSHLWTATQEQRDWRRSSHEASSANIWALSWSTKLQELKPGRQRVIDVGRLKCIRLV